MIYFLLEEQSMKDFLQPFIPRLIPRLRENEDFQLVPHQGRQALTYPYPT
ncbi:MAG: hypothetical protein LW884_09415 [Bacteroidetes bacterium]|jgi:hypothetical protein|nr:hypothetical protein [Bacteroidota bacterium]